MRRLFIVFAKLLGVLQIYWSIAYLSSILVFASSVAKMGDSEPWQALMHYSGFLVYAALTIVFAWLFLARTTWLADKLKIPKDDDLPALSKDALLNAGIKLIGIYVLAKAIPSLVQGIATASAYRGLWDRAPSVIWTTILPPVLQVIVGLLLTIRTSFVVRIMERGEQARGARILIGGIGILAVLLLFARGLAMNRGHAYRRQSMPLSPTVSYSTRTRAIVENTTNDLSNIELYAVPAAGDTAFTNGLPSSTNASIVEVVDFFKEKSEDATIRFTAPE
jgi:MFS family permease